MRRFVTPLAGLVALLLAVAGYAAPVVRAEQHVSVLGKAETWKLVWGDKPSQACGIDDIETANTCPCEGFAYGETGRMTLIRMRDGKVLEQLKLDPLFAELEIGPADAISVMPRWPIYSKDLERADRGDKALANEIVRRPIVPAMKFASYAGGTQFLIQIDAGPCGHRAYVAVGITDRQPNLHALTSLGTPGRPLAMPLAAWQALASGPGDHAIVELECGDHGSEVHDDLIVAADDGRINVRRRRFQCDDTGKLGALLSETKE